jgi:hypothetical protein
MLIIIMHCLLFHLNYQLDSINERCRRLDLRVTADYNYAYVHTRRTFLLYSLKGWYNSSPEVRSIGVMVYAMLHFLFIKPFCNHLGNGISKYDQNIMTYESEERTLVFSSLPERPEGEPSLLAQLDSKASPVLSAETEVMGQSLPSIPPVLVQDMLNLYAPTVSQSSKPHISSKTNHSCPHLAI